jgi:hypothetical protein
MEKLRAPISDDLKDSIKYMRRRVELKHRNLDLDIQEQENKRRLKIIEDEMAKDENGLKDFSKYMFDNCTGKVTDISKDFKLSAIWEEAKKSKFPNEMVCTKTTAEIMENTECVKVKPEELPVKAIVKTFRSQESFTDEELDGIDITGNHMFIAHDSMQDSSYPTTKRNSS